MNDKYAFIRPALVILFLAAPAVSLKVVSTYSNDPYLQPLHITKESLAAAAMGDDFDGLAAIRVDVDWGQGFDGAMTRDRLRQMLSATLDAQTDYFMFKFRDVPGNRIGVSFTVGANHYGPYPPGGLTDGLYLALTALRMTNKSGS
ncbi:hypothetical protein N4R57_05460 [Rhodobacteraceae bacterium D3-12]|nr:hypothetical protein N4R57_05460 [Rhodobacteraceae bacterium D3-12]